MKFKCSKHVDRTHLQGPSLRREHSIQTPDPPVHPPLLGSHCTSPFAPSFSVHKAKYIDVYVCIYDYTCIYIKLCMNRSEEEECVSVKVCVKEAMEKGFDQQ